MDYEHDMGPYVRETVDWLEDDQKPYPCNGESAYKDFEIMMAACRSVVQRGKVKLPLDPGEPELEALKKVLPD
jgi:Lon protease-like protein